MDDRFPYEYGSDLHWLWGWSQRINDWQTNDCVPTRLEHLVFRPDRLARDATTRFGITYSQVIRQVLDYLDHTEAAYNVFLTNSDPQSWQNFAESAGCLQERIQRACVAINEASTLGKSDDWSAGRTKAEWLAIKHMTTDQWNAMRKANAERIQHVQGNQRSWQFKRSLCDERGFLCPEFAEK